MKCKTCSNQAFFKYLSGENKDMELCPICYLKRFKSKLKVLTKGLSKIEESLKNHDGYVELYIDGKENPVWTGIK